MIKSYAGTDYAKWAFGYEEGSTKPLATLLDELQSDVDGIAEEDQLKEDLFEAVKLPLARRVYAKLIKDED